MEDWKLSPLEEDLAVISKLEDEPNDVSGMTPEALKAAFDRSGLTIQQYLNQVLLPQLEQQARQVLAQATGYADQKVVQVGTSDMAQAIYDVEHRREDVFSYARQIAQTAAQAAAEPVQALAQSALEAAQAAQAAVQALAAQAVISQQVRTIARVTALPETQDPGTLYLTVEE